MNPCFLQSKLLISPGILTMFHLMKGLFIKYIHKNRDTEHKIHPKGTASGTVVIILGNP